jgi:hypothetical protein
MQIRYKLKGYSSSFKFEELGISQICNFPELIPDELISHIFSYLDFSGKLYINLSCKKYKILTDESLKLSANNFSHFLRKKNISEIRKIHKQNNVWLRLCMDGHLETIERLTLDIFKIDSYLFNCCAFFGHLKILKIFYSNNYYPTPKALNYAARGGQLKILKWLKSLNDPNWNSGRLIEIARHNNRKNIVAWLETI